MAFLVCSVVKVFTENYLDALKSEEFASDSTGDKAQYTNAGYVTTHKSNSENK